MLTLLIADCNEAFRLSLAEEMQTRFRVLSCAGGKKALTLLRQEKPELLVLDLTLPEMDGIALLETIAAEGLQPQILCVSSMLTPYVLEALEQLGIRYLMRKPCSLQAVAARLTDLAGALETPLPDLRDEIRQLLGKLSLSGRHNGRDYLVEAIALAIPNPDFAVTKDIYPAVARHFGCKSGHVERSVRSALEFAWEHGDAALWQQYFPDTSTRPSNAVFIRQLAASLRE